MPTALSSAPRFAAGLGLLAYACRSIHSCQREFGGARSNQSQHRDSNSEAQRIYNAPLKPSTQNGDMMPFGNTDDARVHHRPQIRTNQLVRCQLSVVRCN
jgi:hypothetical protein